MKSESHSTITGGRPGSWNSLLDLYLVACMPTRLGSVASCVMSLALTLMQLSY